MSQGRASFQPGQTETFFKTMLFNPKKHIHIQLYSTNILVSKNNYQSIEFSTANLDLYSFINIYIWIQYHFTT